MGKEWPYIFPIIEQSLLIPQSVDVELYSWEHLFEVHEKIDISLDFCYRYLLTK